MIEELHAYIPEGIATNARSGRSWTIVELGYLSQQGRKRTPARAIARKLGRTRAAVYAMATRMEISLKGVS